MEFNQPYNREEFLNFLRRDFLPDDFVQQESNVPIENRTYSKKATKLGVCKSLDLVVYEVVHIGKDDPRIGLSKEAFRMLSEEFQARALVLFVPQDNPANYRFSLIEIKVSEVTENGKLVKVYSNPRRYSYLLGKGIGLNTPKVYLAKVDKQGKTTRIVDTNDLRERFSVEVLTKEFYAELSDWYAWAVTEVRFPGETKEVADDKNLKIEHNSKNVIRLLTRLLFVWFLKQKHLIPDEFFNVKYLGDKLLKDFDPYLCKGVFSEKGIESIYYKAILQNLFFAMLNCPIVPQSKDDTRERGFRKNNSYRQHRDANYLMRYENLFKNPTHFLELANRTVPFLNGGLFDCLDNKSAQPPQYVDGFSDNLTALNLLNVPDYLFFGEEKGKNVDLTWFYGADRKKKSVNVRGLINILENYNFTIEENTPFDQEVSLDPELLGKVFENLLASYNPETKTTARKQTGSFYTPREIVQYMVDESLVAHLKRTVGEELEGEYRKLMQYTDDELILTVEQKKAIIKSLFDCKIVDPACGSGAFPVGILQQMVHVLSQLDPGNEYWKSILIEGAVAETSTAYKELSSSERTDAVTDIERNFDNDLNRPDYARKLYLIENCIYGIDIQPIAVQISKLRFFISLVVEQNVINNATENFGIRPLPNLEAKFVAANTLIGLDKQGSISETDEVRTEQEKLKRIRHKIFSARRPDTKRKLQSDDAECRSRIAELLKSIGFMQTNSADKMAAWNPYDQNASSPFFDPEWMFGVCDGFDIVIGNPPYLRIQGIRDANPAFAEELVKKYKSATGSFDLYAVFVERGTQIINPYGFINYIMPMKWTNASFGKGLRGVVYANNSACKIINFGAYQVFNASTYTALQWFKRNCDTLSYVELDRNLNTNKELGLYLDSLSEDNFAKIPSSKLKSDAWVLTVGDTTKLLNRLEEHPRRMKDIFDRIFCGLQTSKDDVYFLYKCREDGDIIVGYSKHLEREVRIERGLVKPLLKGEDVHRYDNISTDRFVVFPYILSDGKANLYPEKQISELFPIGYAYLKECEDVLRGREKGRLMNDEFWYRYIYPKNLVLFDNEKLVAPEISLGGNFTYDKKGEFYSNTKIYGYIKKEDIKESYKFWLGLFNSRLFWFFLQNTGYVLRGGYFTFKTNYINPFPVPAEIPAKINEAISNLADKILEAKKLDPKADTTVFEAEIDSMVYTLYNLTSNEIAIITKQ